MASTMANHHFTAYRPKERNGVNIFLLKRVGNDDNMSLCNLSEWCTKREEMLFLIRYNDTIIMKGEEAWSGVRDYRRLLIM